MNKLYSAQHWKDKLGLESHVEGGAFKEIYRSAMILPQTILTDVHTGNRNASTSIYFLLEYGEFSALHRIASDELWHHYDGSTLCIYEIQPDGNLIRHLLGKDIEKGEYPQILIPAGSWFGSRVEEPDGYTLCGCTVSPGFDFADFELANKDELTAQYPHHKELVEALT